MSHSTPLHLRLVSVFAIIWYGLNAADYTATQMRLSFYTNLFSDEQVAYFTTMPTWIDGIWAIGVWGGLLGAMLMWNGRRRAAAVLSLGAAGMALLTLWLLIVARPTLFAVTGWTGVWIMVAASAVSIFIWLYARAMHARGGLP